MGTNSSRYGHQKSSRTYVVYLNMESDMDTIVDYIMTRAREVRAEIEWSMGVSACMLMASSSLAQTTFCCHSQESSRGLVSQIDLLNEKNVMFCGQRILKQGATVTVHQDFCIEDLHDPRARMQILFWDLISQNAGVFSRS